MVKASVKDKVLYVLTIEKTYFVVVAQSSKILIPVLDLIEFLQIRWNFLSAVHFFRRYFTNGLLALRTNQNFSLSEFILRSNKQNLRWLKAMLLEIGIWHICDIDMLMFQLNKDNPSVDEQCKIVDDNICQQLFKKNHKNKCIDCNELLNTNFDCLVITERMQININLIHYSGSILSFILKLYI